MSNTPVNIIPEGANGCCDDNVVSPTKSRRNGNNAADKFIIEYDNPIPKEIEDTDEIKKFFKKYPFVPYAGTRYEPKQSFLNLLIDLTETSPTLSGCITQIGRFSFNNGFYLVDQPSNIFTVDELNISSVNDQLKYSEFTKSVSYGDYNFVSFIHAIYKNYKNGNVWIEYQEIETGGSRDVRFIIHDPRTCLYWLEPDTGDVEYVGISKRFDEWWLNEHPPTVIPKWPYKTEDDNGVSRSMFHFHTDTSGYYGRPDWISSFVHCYREYQDSLFLAKMAANNFTGQVIVEFEDDSADINDVFSEGEAKAAGFNSTNERLEYNFSNKSPDPSTMWVMTRPYGSRPVEVKEIKPNTNENFYKVTDEITEKKILIANNWSKRLLTGDAPTGLSGTPFIDELKTKEKSVIAFYQNVVEDIMHEVFKPAMDFLGYVDLANTKLRFYLPYSDDEGKEDDVAKTEEV